VAGAFLATLVAAAGSDRLAYDFREGYLPAAEALRSHGSPYLSEAVLSYVYPPLLSELLLPLSFVPDDVAAFVGFVLAFAAVMAAMAVVGVRDVRCYAAVIIAPAAWNTFETGNLTAGLTLAAALVWRYRDGRWAAPAALGVGVSAKLILWPLLVWAAATRRLTLVVRTIAISAVVTLGTWAMIGFAGLLSFPDELARIRSEDSYSFHGMTGVLGLSSSMAYAASAVVGGLLLAGVVAFRREQDEVRAFTCAVAAALAFSPVVWAHYFTLLFVPLAIARPAFSAIWLVPIVLWLCPTAGNGGDARVFLPALVATALVVSLLKGRSHGVAVEAATT
jgi:hypothetical protein